MFFIFYSFIQIQICIMILHWWSWTDQLRMHSWRIITQFASLAAVTMRLENLFMLWGWELCFSNLYTPMEMVLNPTLSVLQVLCWRGKKLSTGSRTVKGDSLKIYILVFRDDSRIVYIRVLLVLVHFKELTSSGISYNPGCSSSQPPSVSMEDKKSNPCLDFNYLQSSKVQLEFDPKVFIETKLHITFLGNNSNVN